MAASLIYGLDKYPDLVKRLNAELKYAPTTCGVCGKNKVIRKYQTLLSERVKKDKRIK